MKLLPRLEDRPLLLDGPLGTELHRRGVDTRLPLWSARALLDQQAVVQAIHADYAAAGAEMHTANTFRANARTLEQAGLLDRMPRLVGRAVDLARRGAGGGWVAGSLAPVEDCYRPDLVPEAHKLAAEHGLLAGMLAEAGVDAILVETMNCVREAAIAHRAARRTGLPTLLSVVCRPDGRLLSGEDFPKLVQALKPGPDVLMVNCSSLGATGTAVQSMRRAWGGLWGAYANVGTADPVVGWDSGRSVSDGEYVAAASAWLAAGANVVGSCCGTTPSTTAALRALL